MGGNFSAFTESISSVLTRKRVIPGRVLILGLDDAGKTTIFYKLKLGKVVATVPTVGFNVEDIEHKGKSFTVYDLGGRDRIRPLWRVYYVGILAIIYVVDSTNIGRMSEAKEELGHIFSSREVKEAPLLILANKQDLPNALDATSVARRLRVDNWPCHVQPCSAISGDGLHEGLDWLTKVLGQRVSYPSDDTASSIL